jgi:hypothetical protein
MALTQFLDNSDNALGKLRKFVLDLDKGRNAIELELINGDAEEAIEEITRLMRYLDRISDNAELRQSLDILRYQVEEAK